MRLIHPVSYTLSRRRAAFPPCIEAAPSTWLLAFLLILALLYTLYLVRALVVPIVLVLLLYLGLSPLVGGLARLRLPRALAAALVVLGLTAATGGGIYALADPATAWLRQAPTALQEMRAKLNLSRGPLADLQRASQTVASILATGGRVGRDLCGLPMGFGNRRRALRIGTAIRREISYYSSPSP